MKVGSYVKQHVAGVYRYGVVLPSNYEPHILEIHNAAGINEPVTVAFTPTRSYPVGVLPYTEIVAKSKLEVVSV